MKPHVLRYWEQEFTQLKPVKRGGNRRYYQHHEVMLIRRIRQLLYQEGFTIRCAQPLWRVGDPGAGRTAWNSSNARDHAAQLRAEIAATLQELRA